LKSLHNDILRLAVPNILTNLTVPLLGLVDIGLMGHLTDAVYLGAVALGSTIFSLLYSGLLFLRMSITGFTAQAYGAGYHRESSLVLGRGVFLALIMGVMLILAQHPIEWGLFKLVNASDAAERIAVDYFRVRIWAAPATLCVFVFTGWFLGMQNSRIPLLIAVVINVVNILLSILFVNRFGMNAAGVALGTVIAQYCGLLISVLCFLKYYGRFRLLFSLSGMIRMDRLTRFFKVNGDILVRSILITGTFFYFNAVSASMGNLVLSVNSILLQFLYIFSYFIDGFAFAAESLTGKMVGSGDNSGLRKLVKTLFLWSGILSLAFSLSYLVFGNDFISLLTDNSEIVSQVKPFFFWAVLIPVVSFAAFVWDGIYIGATASRYLRNAILIVVLVFFLPASYFMKDAWGNHGLWLSLIIFLSARGVMLGLYYRRAIMRR